MDSYVKIKNALKARICDIINNSDVGLIPTEYASSVEIAEFMKVGRGLTGSIYAFSLICPSANTPKKRRELELVLKIYRENEGYICQREGKILKLLRSKGFSVPYPYVVEIDDKILGKPFIIMEKVRGKPLGKYIKLVSNEALFDIIKRFAEKLALLHSLSCKDISFLKKCSDEYEYATSQAFLAKNLKDSFGVKGDFDWIIEWIDSCAFSHPCHQYSVLHGDMHLDNFVVTENGRIVVLDWEFPEIGDPLRDVALAYLNLIFAFGFRKLGRGKEIGEFFVCHYAKKINRKIEPLTLHFYIVVSALVESICYKFNCKQALNPFLTLKKLGVKFFLAAPFLSWYFWWRSNVLMRLIKEEIKCYNNLRGRFSR